MSYKVLRAKTGQDKNGKDFYSNIGRVIETSKGQSIKIDVIPVGWDGWAMMMDPLPPREDSPKRRADDDIPF